MKKLFSVIILAFSLSLVSFAQKPVWTIHAGGLASSYYAKYYDTWLNQGFSGYFAGVEASVPINSNGFSILSGLNLDHKKLTKYNRTGITLNYLRVPVHIMFSAPISVTEDFFFSLGPSVNIGLFDDKKITVDPHQGYLSKPMKINRIHAQIGFTAGVVFSEHLKFSVGYDLGVTKGVDSHLSNRINALHGSIGYSF